MSDHNCCAACGRKIELGEKLDQVEVYVNGALAFSITTCHIHTVEFFLSGQYRFLESYQKLIVDWILKNGLKEHIATVYELLSDYEKIKNRIPQSND